MTDKDKKLDFGKLNSRKKNRTTNSAPQKIYKEVEMMPKANPEAKPVKSLPAKETPSPEKATTPPPAVQIRKKAKAPKQPGKVGRKSWKEPGIEYTRLAFDTPMETKQKLKQLLATTFFNKFSSQDEMINHALNEFIKKYTK